MAYSEIDFSDPGFLMNYCENLSLEIAALKAEVKKLTAHNTSISKLLDTIELQIGRIDAKHYIVPATVLEAQIIIKYCVSKLRDRRNKREVKCTKIGK